MPQKPYSRRDGASSSKITDSRFSNFETDPRFRMPSRRKNKTTIDKRFSHMLKDEDFISTARVDRYGRKLKTDSRKKALQRLYQEEEDENDSADDDDEVRRELKAANERYDRARGGGSPSSESESESDDEGIEAEHDGSADQGAGADVQRFGDQSEVETGEVTNRLAVLNLDWDFVKSMDLMALFSSFLPVGGRIEKISIYPSEFGKMRMEREELEGPPKDIFKKAPTDEGSDSEDDDSEGGGEDDPEADSDEEIKKDLITEGADEDFDTEALRTYQLERLRYYYAVAIFSDPSAAQRIYEATDGSEYLSSGNFLDLRFVPEDVTFDDEPHDECDSVPNGYKPIEFVTDALQHSKVKLTWDLNPDEPSRKESIKKAFSGSRADIAENDLHAYLASDSDGEESEPVVEATGEPNLTKKELARQKLRQALGLTDDPVPKSLKTGPVGEMEITFTPALTGKDSSKKSGGAGEEETTVEKYMRKERERKEKKREKAKAKRGGTDPDDAGTGDEDKPQDLGFDDPFFTTEAPEKASKSSMRKEERRKKREAREAEAAKSAVQKAQLELLMADNPNDGVEHLDHFDMNEIMRAEKQKSKRGKKKGKQELRDQGGLQEDFNMDVEDPRFKAVFEDYEFAIDPSNPRFKATQGMKKLLEEGRKKRKHGSEHASDGHRGESAAKKAKATASDLGNLVKAVKKSSGRKGE